MEDFDVFTNEINFTKPLFKNILNKYVNEVPSTPNGPNYQSKFSLKVNVDFLHTNKQILSRTI